MPGNTFLTRQEFTRETLMILSNNLKAAATISNGYDDQFGVTGAKIGQTINIRKPVRFKGRQGQGWTPEGIQETFVPLTLNYQSGVDFEMNPKERKLDMDYLRQRILKPSAVTIANQIDATLLYNMYLQTFNYTGVPGTVPNTQATYLDIPRQITENGAPVDDDITCLVTPNMQSVIVNANLGLFHDPQQLQRGFKDAKMRRAFGMNWDVDQQLPTHTIGTYAGAGRVNGANQTGSLLLTNNWTAASVSFLPGDIITIAGVFAVNPQVGANGVKKVYSRLQTFVITAPVVDAAGAVTLPISPAIVATGPYQNVSNTPAANATITVFGAASTVSEMGLAYHKTAFSMASVKLDEPGGVEETFAETDPDTGVSILYVRQYIATTFQYVNRFDVLWGETATYPELSVRVAS